MGFADGKSVQRASRSNLLRRGRVDQIPISYCECSDGDRYCCTFFLVFAEKNNRNTLTYIVLFAQPFQDKELKQLRNNRWDKAFSGDVPVTEEEVHAAVNRKATIVLEHLIQASDVSHTMQHWHVYRKWNERLFHEMYNAYRAGRAEKDPAEFWYKVSWMFV